MTTTTVDGDIVYNRGGVVIVEMTAQGTNASSGSTAVVPKSASRTVVLLHVTSSNYAVSVTDDFEIGDVVDFYTNSQSLSAPTVFLPSGETIFDGNDTDPTNIAYGVKHMRKVTSDKWARG